jgi:hypothetical protein
MSSRCLVDKEIGFTHSRRNFAWYCCYYFTRALKYDQALPYITNAACHQLSYQHPLDRVIRLHIHRAVRDGQGRFGDLLFNAAIGSAPTTRLLSLLFHSSALLPPSTFSSPF